MADENRPAYCNLFPSDWIAGCATLPPMVEWVYWQISLYNMDKGEPVPENRLAMVLLRHGGNWENDLDLLIDMGKVHKTNGKAVFVKRALVEYERAEKALRKKQNAGRKGAQKRWENNDEDSNAIASPMPSQCDTNSNQEPRTKNQEPRTKIVSNETTHAQGDLIFSVDPDSFAEFKKHRRELGKPLSKTAEARLIKRLEKIMQEHGHDPTAILMQSIDQGWIGIFPLKDDGGKKRSGWRFPNE